jgi:polyphosphate glucokinase
VRQGRPFKEPHNLAPGWVGFDFEAAFGRPIKLINDSAMQAIGSYRGGTMLFLGLGTGFGSTLIAEHFVMPLELGHLPYKRGTFEDYVGKRGLKQSGIAKWRCYVDDIVARLMAAFHPDDVVIGGGNVELVKTMPPGCRPGSNANAFVGGFRLWESPISTNRKEFRSACKSLVLMSDQQAA